MKILNMKLQLTDLNGDSVAMPDSGELLMISRILANVLSGKTKGIEPSKAMDWAYKLYNDGIIKVDNTDFIKLKEFINSCGSFSNIQIYQILKAMDDFTEENDAKEETTEEGTQEK